METSADEILPGLWIGNKASSTDREFLGKHRITAVFNCTKNLIFDSSVKHQYRVPLDDNLQPEEIRNMELWAPEIAYKIAAEMRRVKPVDEAVLVHCHAGMQRSAGSVALYMIAVNGLTTDEAIAAIKKKRSIAFKPAANFERALRGFEVMFKRDIKPRLEQQRLA
jgi:protein-tyrosine phosphatase